jgi:plasmid replication initiation protein
MNLQINMKSPLGDNYISITSFITRIEKPKKVDGKSVLYLRMDKDVASQLIQVDRNLKNQPINYTKYLLEVALRARSKYTFRLYAYISSWKQKGGFVITLDELRSIVGVEQNEYAEYSQFKRRVLLPVQKELENQADCWFNCSASDFEIRDGKKVTRLRFKVIVPEMQEALRRRAEMIKALLKNHFGFQDGHFKTIDPLFSRNFNEQRADSLMSKIVSLNEYIKKLRGSDDEVNDKASYALKSILNHFQEELAKL